MPAVDFLLGGSDQRVEQVIGLDTEPLTSRYLNVGLRAIFFFDLVTQLQRAARRERHHLVGEMRVVRGLFGVAQQANGLDDSILRIRLPRINDVIDRRDIAEVWMVSFALLGRDPDLMLIGIAIEPAIAKVAPQQPKLPQVIGDVLADIAHGAIRPYDDFRVFVGPGLLLRLSSRAKPRDLRFPGVPFQRRLLALKWETTWVSSSPSTLYSSLRSRSTEHPSVSAARRPTPRNAGAGSRSRAAESRTRCRAGPWSPDAAATPPSRSVRQSRPARCRPARWRAARPTAPSDAPCPAHTIARRARTGPSSNNRSAASDSISPTMSDCDLPSSWVKPTTTSATCTPVLSI